MMKKTALFILFLLAFFPASARASQYYEEVLSDKIREYGIWDGEKGIVYAGKIEFDTGSLLIVNADKDAVSCEVYNDADGLQLTDTIDFSCDDARVCRLVTVKANGRNYIMFSRLSDNEFYTIENDTYVRAEVSDYYPVSSILSAENGKITPSASPSAVYNLLNRLKEESMSEYTFTNKINSLDAGEAQSIRKTLTACADIMSFDIRDYDYDRLFRYILYTHENFRILTDIDPKSGESSTLGYNNVSLVSSEFIDYIMENIFRITPEKPPVNNLLSRSFCYNDGYYFYTGGFEVYFATEILNLTAAYDLGGGTLFVIFSDIYREDDSETPEYSFAVLQKSSGGYSVLRLGMGESLPSQAELRKYSPYVSYGASGWQKNNDRQNGIHLFRWHVSSDLLFNILLVILSVGVVGIVCSIVFLIASRRK